MKKNTKFDAFLFTKAFLGAPVEQKTISNRVEPKNRLGLSEAVVQSMIIDYLSLQMAVGRLFFSRVNNTPIYDQLNQTYRALSKGQRKGFPDLLIVQDGRVIFVELKSSVGNQSPEQVETQSLIEAQNVEYYVVRTLDFLKAILQERS